MKKTKSLVGRKYGKLLVLAETNKLEARYKVWECRCECGEITFVNTKTETRTITNCSCIPKNKAKRTEVWRLMAISPTEKEHRS